MGMLHLAFESDQSLMSHSVSFNFRNALITQLFSGDLTICIATELLHTNSHLAGPWVSS